MATRSLVASDAFSSAGALGSPNWQQMRTYGGTVTGTGSAIYSTGFVVVGADIGSARWIGSGSFTADQYSSIVLGGLTYGSSQQHVCALVRCSGGDDSSSGGATRNYYVAGVQYDGAGTYTTVLGRVVNGVFTSLHSAAQAWSNGDRLELEVEGTTLRVCRNGTPLGGSFTQTDSSLSSGVPGVGGSGGDNTIVGDSWEGGNLITFTLDQTAFRFGTDDGSESAHTWLDSQNTSIYRALGSSFLLRALLQATGDPATAAYTLRAQKNGAGGYVAVPVGTGNAEALMQPTWGAAGTAASGTTSCTPAYPTGISANTSKLFCLVTGRGNTAGTVPTMPSGWTRVGGLEGGTGTWGVDLGTRRVDFFQKDTVAGTETGTVTVSLSGTTNNTLRATIFRVEVTSGYGIDVELVSGADTSNDTSYSATASANATFDSNRLVLIGTAQNVDTGTASSRAISASGITFGTLTNRADTAVTNGNDHRHILNSVPVSSGSGTVAPTFSYTISASGSGPTAFLVLRGRLPAVTNELYVTASSNIAAGGEATTQRLSGGTGTFLTGRRWDDENGTDSLDLAADNNTEVEWSLNTQSPAVNGDYWDFRVYSGGSALSTYTQTPRLTLGTPAAAYPPGLRSREATVDPDLDFALRDVPQPVVESLPAWRLVSGPVAVGSAIESDSALPFTARKVKAVGPATETDSAQPLTRVKQRAAETTAETDAAQALARSKQRALVLAAESDTAQALARTKAKTLGLGSETDSAQALTASKRLTVGLAAETDAAQPITRQVNGQTQLLGVATESDAAQPLARVKLKAIGQAVETEAAQPLVRAKTRAVGTSTSVESAQAFARFKQKLLGVAPETDSAVSISRAGQTVVALGTAFETDSALPIGLQMIGGPAPAVGFGLGGGGGGEPNEAARKLRKRLEAAVEEAAYELLEAPAKAPRAVREAVREAAETQDFSALIENLAALQGLARATKRPELVTMRDTLRNLPVARTRLDGAPAALLLLLED